MVQPFFRRKKIFERRRKIFKRAEKPKIKNFKFCERKNFENVFCELESREPEIEKSKKSKIRVFFVCVCA